MVDKEKKEKEIYDLAKGLKDAISQRNVIKQEFCGALLSKYDQEMNIYEYLDKEEYEKDIKDGLNLFLLRKRKFDIKKRIFNLITGLTCGLFAYFYLLLPISKSFIFFVVGFLIDSLIKINVNKVVFVNEARKAYAQKVEPSLLKIRESEDLTKLWI